MLNLIYDEITERLVLPKSGGFKFYDKKTEQGLYEQMRDYPLEPTQLLWLGPQSVRILASGSFRGKLPDKLVLEKAELGVTGWKLGEKR